MSGLSIERLELPGQPRFRVRHARQELGRRRPREVGEARKLRQCVPRVRRGERRRQRRGSHRLLARSPRRDLVLEQGQRPLQERVTKDGGRLVHQREVGLGLVGGVDTRPGAVTGRQGGNHFISYLKFIS